MKKLLFLLLGVLIALPSYALGSSEFKYTYEGQTVIYSASSSNTCMTRMGNTDNPGNIITGDLNLPAYPKKDNNTYTLTEIGYHSFFKCRKLTSVKIPNTVTYIGTEAFYDCHTMTSIEIGNSVKEIGKAAFASCYALTSVKIPNSVETIGDQAFSGCSGLTSVEIPASVQVIGDDAFSSCSSLENIYVEEGNLNYVSENGVLFNLEKTEIIRYPEKRTGAYKIPNTVTSIGKHAFRGCTDLTSIEIPSSVTSIGEGAFESCTSLPSVEIPGSVRTIGGSAFSRCYSLTSVAIPNSVTNIGENAFSKCSSLTAFTVANGETNITFEGNTFTDTPIETLYMGRNWTYTQKEALAIGLKSLTIGDQVTAIPDYAFNDCSSLTSVIIPNFVTTIGDYAFSDCGLTAVEIPNSVQTIGGAAFLGCSGLTSISIGNSVKSIGDYAFSDCSLTSIEIPTSVTSIGKGAFSRCNPTTVIIPNSVTSISQDAFYGCKNLIKSAYPNTIKNPFSNGVVISYPAEDAVIEDGWVYGSDKSAIYFAPLSLEGEYTVAPSVKTIGQNAFYKCEGLTSVAISNSVETICSSAFSNCSNLAALTVVDGETTLAFEKDALKTAPVETLYMGRSWTYTEKAAISTGLKSLTLGDQVTTLPDYAFNNCTGLTDITIPNSVATIGNYAFAFCSGLTSVEIPNSVTSIGESAFKQCTKMPSVGIGNLVETIGSDAFYGCSGLTSVVIPNSVTTIGNNAFYGCSGLTSVVIPNSVTTIGNDVFYGCKALIKSAYPGNITNPFLYWSGNTWNGEYLPYGICISYPAEGAIIEDGFVYGPDKSAVYFAPLSFEGEFSIPSTVKSIENNAFYKCSNLTSVEIPNSVKTIGEKAFRGCSTLTSVKIGNSIETIGEKAFADCSGLTKAEFASVEALCKIEFADYLANPLYYAHHLYISGEEVTDLVIPESVKSIGINTFSRCSDLTSVKVSWQTPLAISKYVFSDDTYKNATLDIPENTLVDYLASVWSNFNDISVDGTATKVFTDDVFKYRLIENPENREAVLIEGDYSKMTEANIPERFTDESDPDNPVRYYVTAIGPNAFKDCTKLNSVKLNSRSILHTIGESAFNGCSVLTGINIPATVTEIKDLAFSNCRNLISITIPEVLTTIGKDAFSGCRSMKYADFASVEALCKIKFANADANPLSQAAHLYINEEEITEVVIPDGIDELNYTFVGGSYITSVGIPNSVQTIGENAFYGCSGLTKAEFASIEALCKIKFGNVEANPLNYAHHLYIGGEEVTDIKVPQTIDSLAYTFAGGNSLTSMFIPKSVNYIGESTFSYCSKLINFEVENCNDLLELGKNALKDAHVDSLYMGRDWNYADNSSAMLTSLKSVKLSDNVTAIPDNAFRSCRNLTTIAIPASVDSIGSNAFYDCRNLDSVALVDSEKDLAFGKAVFTNTYIKKLFVGRPFNEGYFSGRTSITKLIIGNMMTEIAASDFKGCNKIDTLVLGSSLVTIGDEAFSGCTGLTEVIVPPSVETIGESAFAGNSKLESIIMGHNVKTIGANAFKDAPAKTVSITAQVPPTAPNTTFSTYTGKLWLQDPGDQSVMDAYYDAFTCWDRFDSYAMVTPVKIEGETQEIKGVPGETFQLTAKVWPENVTLPQVFWRSTNPDIAVVDENGLVTLKADISDIINSRAGSDEEVRSCKIIAETLYADGPVLEVTVYDESSAGIDEIVADKAVSGEIDYDAPYEVYNLNGMYVGDDIDALGRGFYIVRQGRVAKKTAIN